MRSLASKTRMAGCDCLAFVMPHASCLLVNTKLPPLCRMPLGFLSNSKGGPVRGCSAPSVRRGGGQRVRSGFRLCGRDGSDRRIRRGQPHQRGEHGSVHCSIQSWSRVDAVPLVRCPSLVRSESLATILHVLVQSSTVLRHAGMVRGPTLVQVWPSGKAPHYSNEGPHDCTAVRTRFGVLHGYS